MREISHHILDVARNSVEAGAGRLDLLVRECVADGVLHIEVHDDGPGMDVELARTAADPFVTSRTTRKVGLGLSLLKATCERCGGTLEIESAPGRGTVVRADLEMDCIDRPPLGDMGAVVQSLACSENGIAVGYRHEVDGRAFEVSTEEMQQELRDVPITEPSVLKWLREHVNESIADLGSTA